VRVTAPGGPITPHHSPGHTRFRGIRCLVRPFLNTMRGRTFKARAETKQHCIRGDGRRTTGPCAGPGKNTQIVASVRAT